MDRAFLRIALIVPLLACGVGPSLAQESGATRTWVYKTYREDTRDVVSETTRSLESRPDGGFLMHVEWKSFADSTSGTHEYVLDSNYATLQWSIDHPDENTRYTGKREGDELVIEGTHKGEPVSLRIEIDDKPFFSTPSVGLQGFVRSGKRKTEFRTLRPTDLNEYKMKASAEKEMTLSVLGEDVETVRVKWGLTGMKSMFFSQTLWFRKVDGVYVRSQVRDGVYHALVSER